MRPASFVACRWASLKYAGTVITAWVTGAPEISLRVALKLAKNVGRYFGWGELRIAEKYAQYFAWLDFFDQAEREKTLVPRQRLPHRAP